MVAIETNDAFCCLWPDSWLLRKVAAIIANKLVNQNRDYEMNIRAFAGLIGLSFFTIAGWSNGEPNSMVERCDCEKTLGSCKAGVDIKEKVLKVTSSSMRCSKVSLLADGEKYALQVVDGEATQVWSKAQPKEITSVECGICEDAQYTSKAQPSSEVTVTATGIVKKADKSDSAPIKKDYGKDLSWLEGQWCWDWYGKPGKNTYKKVKDNVFQWGDKDQHTIQVEGTQLLAEQIGAPAAYVREIIDENNMIWTKRKFGKHEADENVKMWKCDD